MVSETKEELTKLTVPQLKDRLKQRSLAISGTKADLINRLFDSIQEDEILGEAPSTVVTTDADTEEELLGTTAGSTLSTKDEELLLLGLKEDENKPTSPVKTVNASSQPEEKSDGEKKERPAIAFPEGTAKKEKVTAEDAKAKRAARFGITAETEKKKEETKDTPASENTDKKEERKPDIKAVDPKIVARAKRFGIPIVDGVPAKASKQTPKTAEEDEKMKARRLRFGL